MGLVLFPGLPLSECLECLTQAVNVLNSDTFETSNINNVKLKNNGIKAEGGKAQLRLSWKRSHSEA